MLTLGSEHALLEALRVARSEPQLTQALAAVCRDARFAARFVALLLEQASGPSGAGIPVPDRLTCRAEAVVEEGRVDLGFADAPGRWHVLVEIKLHAGYGPGQLTRYLRALSIDAEHAYLVAVTRSVPRDGEEEARRDPRWVGSVRWAKLLPGLRDLRHPVADLDRQWQLFLDVLEKEGAMGFTAPDPRLLDAWTLARRARSHVELLVETVQDGVLRSAAERLGGGAGGGAAFRTVGSGRVVHHDSGDALLRLRIPAGGPERLRAGLRGWQPPLRMIVGVRVPDSAPSAGPPAALQAVRALGYEPRRGSSFLYRTQAISEAEKASANLPDLLLAWFEDRFQELGGTAIVEVPLTPGDPDLSPETEEEEPDSAPAEGVTPLTELPHPRSANFPTS